MGDITQYDDEWLKGVTTYDLVALSKHLLGKEPLADGYKMLAADANKSNSLTSFDMVEFRKLLLGYTDKLPNYDQPWRFIPEVFTQTLTGGTLQDDFNGGGNDDPFETTPAIGLSASALNYCEDNWPFIMTKYQVRNGFDAVKLGNLNGDIAGIAEDCQGEVLMLMPNLSVAPQKYVELTISAYNFDSVGAFQMGLSALSEEFEFISLTSNSLPSFSAENQTFGGLNLDKDNIKVSWLSDSLLPRSIPDGNQLMKLTLKTKTGLENIAQNIGLDDNVWETYFLDEKGDCLSNISLQVSISIWDSIGTGVDGRSFQQSQQPDFISSRIYCVPNPATESATILFDANHSSAGVLSVYDNKGAILERSTIDLQQGRNLIPLTSLNSFPNGILHITVYDGVSNHIVRAVKQ